MSSHALLLRLFLSPSFFSVHVALRYLMTYSDNIGITYYLTRRLSDFTVDELRDVWGFICHLLISRPSQSRALECFVTDICRKSTHIAIITFLFMQAALKDYSSNPQSPEALICQRTLLMCHELIFADLPPPETTPYPSLTPAQRPLFARKKVRPHAVPTFVGIGMILASRGLPTIANIMGSVAVEQGRADTLGSDLRSLQRDEDDVAHSTSVTPSVTVLELDDDDDDGPESVKDESQSHGVLQVEPEDAAAGTNTPKRLQRRNTVVGAARTSPALPLHLQKHRKPRFSDDPLGQLDQDVPSTVAQSTPQLPSARVSRGFSSLNETDMLLAKYGPDAQRELLRKHFCRSEIQFILTLESISNRLLVVPKPARVSALRAELTALNHKLPAEVCMPLWCSSTDGADIPGDSSGAHHRIVRIPPGECVVLNSAERAPYLLLVEILHGDLDFDPHKRANRAILQKMVASENNVSPKGVIPFILTPAPRITPEPSYSGPPTGSDAGLSIEAQELFASPVPSPVPNLSASLADPGDDEEIDLVEQLYGTDESLRSLSVDLSDSIVLPPPPKNKDLDLATWSRTSSSPATPMLDQWPSLASQQASPAQVLSITRSHSRGPPSAQASPRRWAGARDLTLEEYSERMRTAAVMLAQLNASLVWDVPQGHERTATGTLSWLSTGRWFSVLPPAADKEPEKDGRPASVTAMSPSSNADVPRMKLQPAEAAAIRERIMDEMLALEEERMERMRERAADNAGGLASFSADGGNGTTSAEDEGVIRRALTRTDPSALVFSESWAAKKARVRQASPYGHLASWDCASVIVKTGGDLRQEQLACALVLEFARIWKEEACGCWCRPFKILITGGTSGLIETITDAVSIHSIKKAEYARRLASGSGRLGGYVTLLDHFKNTYGHPSSAKFVRAQRNFAKSLAGTVITYLLQIKDRHNGNILLDREGRLVHIDFGFMLANSPGNMGFEAAPFKLPFEYVDVLGGISGTSFAEFRRLFQEGFEAARKHCDRIVTMVELMQKDSTLPCFAAFGEQTAIHLRDRFQQKLTQSLVEEHVERLIDTSLGSHWTRLYDSYQYYSQSIL
ncbi:kinase-like domain-containing protein [Vararia minispora EC-137]|uniref:Kinase-like domain-containing protein n=1 Tax=Vararia minispora EC-137 TaxID=1314806 RepID=A0ACB8QUP8_9AGAM|nr:kinase-like domain-containing protein [Vararia minispora EC-137]